MCNEAVRIEPYSLEVVPDHLKTKEMCNEAVRREPYTLRFVPDHFNTQKMCNEAMCENQAAFFLIPDQYKTQEICNKAVKVDPGQLYDVPDWFVVLQEMWYEDFDDDNHDDDDNDDDDMFIKWYEGYRRRKDSKSKNKGRASTYFMASRSCDELLHTRRRKEAVEAVTDSCF